MKTSFCINILVYKMVWLSTLILSRFCPIQYFSICTSQLGAVMVLPRTCKNKHDFLLLSSSVGRAVSTTQQEPFNNISRLAVNHLQLIWITSATNEKKKIAIVGSVFLYRGAGWSKAFKIRSVCVNEIWERVQKCCCSTPTLFQSQWYDPD